MRRFESRWKIPRALAIVAAAASIAALAAPLSAQAPLTVGAHHPLGIDSSRSSSYEVMQTPGGRVYQVTHPGATYMALHFERFDLAPGDSVVVSDADGGQGYRMTGRGKMQAGEFWAQHVKGDTVVIELFSTGGVPGKGFVIDEYAAGFMPLGPGDEAICGTDDKQNAVCYAGSNPTEYGEAQAVARLLIQGSSLCTGWLASASNHLVTNEHCISSSTAALNTDYEFAAEAPDCNDNNCQLCWPGVVFSGASFIQDSPSLDYALVQITSGNPAATYGSLEIDNRVAVVGEQIYIPQHPGGRAKELGINSTHAADSGGICQVNSITENACSGTGYNDVGYYCDTEGGSSGSPVLATSSHKVIALHHCRGSLTCTNTGGDPNRGVPIGLVCDEIAQWVPSCGGGCTSNDDCDDGDPCTLDICSAGSCSNDPIPGCCGNGVCEVGEDCNSCAADCPSAAGPVCGNGVCEPGEDCLTCGDDCNGRQGGKPANRYCCSGDGLGGGTNPVDCTDSRCGAPASCSGTVLPGFCCGDLTCDGGAECDVCDLDCDGNQACDVCVPTSSKEKGPRCSDGLDNDCDGLIDGADPDC